MGTFMSLMRRSPGAQGGPRVNAEVAPEGHQVGSQPLYAPDADIKSHGHVHDIPQTFKFQVLPSLSSLHLPKCTRTFPPLLLSFKKSCSFCSPKLISPYVPANMSSDLLRDIIPLIVSFLFLFSGFYLL